MGRFPQANKSFGQHFLNSPQVISKITSPLPEHVDAIVEVGPGPAVLTPHLAQYHLPLFLIEMDHRFISNLGSLVNPEHIFQQDALLFDWKSFLDKNKFRSIWLVSNLPYNVSVPLTIMFLKIPEISHMTLMYQKEVAQKILPRHLKNTMNSLQMLMSSQFIIHSVAHAPPGAFVPPPKVDSQVLSFKRKTSPEIPLRQIEQFEKFLRIIFSQKRKQLGGIMKSEWGEEITKQKLSDLGIDPKSRAETLSYHQVIELYQRISSSQTY